MSNVLETYKKYREPLLYVIVGGLTTAVNFTMYFLCNRLFGIPAFWSNCIGLSCSITFAYFVDKIVVFRSKKFDLASLLKEASAFLAARLATALLDIGLFFLLNTLLHINDIVVKIFISVLVVVGNYLFSKFVVFKKA